MKLTLPIADVSEVLALADALDRAAAAHRTAAIGAAEALEDDRRTGEAVPAGAADQVLATLARAGVLERLGKAARSAFAAASLAAQPAAPAPVAAAAPVAAVPVFMPPAAPVPQTAAAAAPLDPENDQVDLWAPGAIT